MDRLAIEPEKIRLWRDNQKQMLEEKGAVSIICFVVIRELVNF